MEFKTLLQAPENTQEIIITRKFDLPIDLLFKAYTEVEFFEQWMHTKVIKFNMQKHGNYHFQTLHLNQVVFSAHGTIHDFVINKNITRTFEMLNSPFPPQIEYLDFLSLTPATSQLNMLIVFKSIYFRNEMLKLPFAQGLNMAHQRLQEILTKHK
jgi:uncharacterized protein YndB with AHSA1/START domain